MPKVATIVIPDEAKSRLGGISSKLLFFLDSGHPPAADSGMTDLAFALQIFSFSAAC